MKKLNVILAFFLLVAVSCNTPNPVEYNNKLMVAMNNNEKDMNDMNAAMNSQDYTKAESVRKTWGEKLGKAVADLEKMDQLKDDEGLKEAVTSGLKGYKKIADEDYKSLIELHTKEKGGDTTVQPQIQSILEKMNNEFETIANKINKAGTAFEKKFAGK